MKVYDSFMNLMSSVMDILPRFLELSEKNIRTFKEEKELEKITIEMEALKEEIIKLIPEINKTISGEFVTHFMKIKKGVRLEEFFTIVKNEDLKQFSHASLDKFIKHSLN